MFDAATYLQMLEMGGYESNTLIFHRVATVMIYCNIWILKTQSLQALQSKI